MDLGRALTTKLGPLPAWGYGVVIAAGVLGWRLFRRPPSDEVTTEAPIGSGLVFPPSDLQGGLLRDDATNAGVAEELAALGARIDAIPPPASFADQLETIRNFNVLSEEIVAGRGGSGAAPPMVAVPPAPPAPTPVAPRVVRSAKPQAGAILWSGQSSPAAATIRALIAARYPGWRVTWEARRRGGNLGWVAVVTGSTPA